ncbi:hypothetical protein BDR06DRAFT_968932 [Suillus hirtellus]|nr:hypothetical protein BDR06DRAFT_968932 [Suillus hirtellus]
MNTTISARAMPAAPHFVLYNDKWVSDELGPPDVGIISNAGISLIVSAFGSTDVPTTDGYDPTILANSLPDYVLEYDLDGVDVDYGVGYIRHDAENGSAEIWLTTFTIALRARLPIVIRGMDKAAISERFIYNHDELHITAISISGTCPMTVA